MPIIKMLTELDMSQRKQALKEWPNEKIIHDLNSRYPGEKTTWIVFDEVDLYGSRGEDGTIFACADDDDLRSIAIQEFIRNRGGEFVTGE